MRAVRLTELTTVGGLKSATTSHSSSLTLRPSPVSGFTLVELIIVIVITGILAIVAAALIRGPVEGYFAQANRADLVDMAQQALNEMATDIRGALPNSVRVSGSNALELIHVVDGARYRSGPRRGSAEIPIRPNTITCSSTPPTRTSICSAPSPSSVPRAR